MQSLLRQCVRSFENCADADSSREYADGLRQCMDAACRILRYNSRRCVKFTLARTASPSARHELAVNAYAVSATTPQIDAALFAETAGRAHRSTADSHFHQALQILQRIRRDYTATNTVGFIDALLALLSTCHKLERLSETQLVEFLSKSLTDELKQFANLQLHLEENGLVLHDDAVRKIADSIESSVGASRSDSLDHTAHLQGLQSGPGFDCSDTNFKIAFYLTLQVVHVRPSVGIGHYVRFMLAYYKEIMAVDWFETAGFSELESKINKINDFLLNTVKLSTSRYRESAISVIDEFDMMPELASNTQPTQSSAPSARIIAKNDETELLANVGALIEELSDSTMNFEIDFRYTLRMYIHMINKNDLSVTEKDINYLNDLIALINVLVEFENSARQADQEQVYRASMQLHRLHRYLSPTGLTDISPNSTILMRYCVYSSSKDLVALRNIIKQWNTRALKASHLDFLLHNTWVEHTDGLRVECVFGMWSTGYKRQLKLRTAASQYYSKKLQARLFFSGWKRKVKQHQMLASRQDEYTYAKFLNKWKSKYNCKIHQGKQAISHHSSTTVGKIFNYWRSSVQKYAKQLEIAHDFSAATANEQNTLTLDLYFHLWYDAIQRPLSSTPHSVGDEAFLLLTDKLRALTLREDLLLYRRYFNAMKKKFKEQQAIAQLKRSRDKLLIHYALNRWCMLTKLATASKFSEQSRHMRIERNIFHHWQHAKEMNRLAKDYRRVSLLSTSFKQWKLRKTFMRCKSNTNSNSTTGSLQRIAREKFFNVWKLKHTCNQAERDHNAALIQTVFTKWTESTADLQRKYQYALAFNGDILSHKYLRHWRSQLQFQTDLPAIAESFRKHLYLNKMVNNYKRYSQCLGSKLREFENQKQKGVHPFCDEILVKSVFAKWKFLHEVKFQENANFKVKHYQKHFGGPLLKHMIFTQWCKAYVSRVNRQQDLAIQASEFSSNSRIKHLMFLKWKQRYHHNTLLQNTGFGFHDQLLRKKYLVIWYDQYKNKNEYLMDISEEFIQQKDLKRIAEILRDWSMKNMKYSSMNHQSCDMFIKRWDSSKMKSVFELWVYKLNQRRSPVKSNDDFFDISNDSIATASPLAVRKKAQASKSEANENYLHTPIKGVFSNVPNTPSVTQNISPTRQQTSLRMKEEKIKKLNEHFSRAKRSRQHTSSRPSAVDTSLTENRPYAFASNPRTRLSPPKRPDFGATSDLNMPFSIESPPRPFTTQVDIETAKKLRRITPIFVPGEEDIEPKMSPILTIKRRNSQRIE